MAAALSGNYATALFQLAKDNDQLLKFKDELNDIVNVFNEHKELYVLMDHPNILKEDKKKLVKELFKGNQLLLNFLMVLIDKSRIRLLTDINTGFIKMANDDLGIKMVVCYSAVILDKTEKKKLIETLAKKYDQQVELKWDIDPSLLAGIKLSVDGEVFDNSALNKLARIKEKVANITLKVEV